MHESDTDGFAASPPFRGDGPEPRLKTEIRVKAHVRRCAVHGIPAVVARRGDADAGAVLVKLNMLENGCKVLVQTRTALGEAAWMTALSGKTVSEDEAENYIVRALERDSDLWVIEIEDRRGRALLNEPII